MSGAAAQKKAERPRPEIMARPPIRVLIADDHLLVLEGIRAALHDAEGIEVVGEARDGSQVLPLANRLQPDVVLLDIRLPKLDGFACLELLRERHPSIKVVMLSAFRGPEHVDAALRRGASGYIVKSVNPLDLPSAVRQAVEGTVFHTLGGTSGDPMREARDAGLTEREIAILGGVARGLSNRALAKELWVTEQTVKFHLTNIYRKLKVTNRTEAARAAFRLGIGDAPLLWPGSGQ
jgi:DNA-binding NarL/FixJ family response regulator